MRRNRLRCCPIAGNYFILPRIIPEGGDKISSTTFISQSTDLTTEEPRETTTTFNPFNMCDGVSAVLTDEDLKRGEELYKKTTPSEDIEDTAEQIDDIIWPEDDNQRIVTYHESRWWPNGDIPYNIR